MLLNQVILRDDDMKKLVQMLIVFNLIIFSVINLINYSNDICHSILKNKTVIQITKPDKISNNDFVEMLESISQECDADFLFRTVEESPNKQQKYVFYRTNNQRNFIILKTERDNSALVDKEHYLSTDPSDNGFEINAFSPFVEIKIMDFSCLLSHELERNTYYISKDKTELLISSLQNYGFQVDLFVEESTGFEPVSLINPYQAFMMFFLMCSLIFYCFSRNKETIVKKIYGYTDLNILIDNIKQFGVFYLLLLFISQIAIESVVSVFFTHAIGTYLFYCLIRYIKFSSVILLVILIGSIYIIVQKDITSIKGNTKDKKMYLIAVFSKTIAVIMIIYYISFIGANFFILKNAVSVLKRTEQQMADYYSTSINVANTSIQSDYLLFESKFSNFCEYLMDEFDTIVCYSGMKDYAGNPILLVNDNYIKANPIINTNGDIINTPQKAGTVFIPDTFSNKYIQENYVSELCENIVGKKPDYVRYASKENIFYTYNLNVGCENYGYLSSPIVISCSKEMMQEYSISLISEGSILIKSHVNPYEEIRSTLLENGLQNLVPNTEKVTNRFRGQLQSLEAKIKQNTIQAIMYAFILITLLFFEIETYYQIYKKEISIKQLNGYGYFSYWYALGCQLLSLLLYVLLAYVFSLSVVVAIVASLTNICLFLHMMNRTCKRNLSNTIKGET